MIERYTLKFALAVSQEELRKQLEAIKNYDPAELDRLHKMRVKVENLAARTCSTSPGARQSNMGYPWAEVPSG